VPNRFLGIGLALKREEQPLLLEQSSGLDLVRDRQARRSHSSLKGRTCDSRFSALSSRTMRLLEIARAVVDNALARKSRRYRKINMQMLFHELPGLFYSLCRSFTTGSFTEQSSSLNWHRFIKIFNLKIKKIK